MELVIEHLSKAFGTKQVLSNINFRFTKGNIYALLGRNGAGKTTFFNCLNGDIKSDSGHFSLLTDHKQRDINIMVPVIQTTPGKKIVNVVG